MPDWVPVNIDLLKNPLNWLVVFFMVIVPLIAVTFVHQHWANSGPQSPQA